MNGNLSKLQFTPPSLTSVTKQGAMPMDTRFNGPEPLKPSASQNMLAANSGRPIPKPGFF